MSAFREASIDLSAIRRNVRTLRAAVNDLPVMVIVKANAYGHGAVESAGAAIEGGAQWLGVADIDEALELRAAGVESPILTWLHDPIADFSEAVAAGIDIGVNHLQQLERVVETAERAMVQLKVDSGLGRNGARPEEWGRMFARAAELEAAGRIRVRALWSHLANAGEAEDLAQVKRFERAIAEARAAGLDPELLHLAASGGALRVPSARFGMVRFGVSTYGLSPFEDEDAASLGLTPVMQLSATLVNVKRVPAGTGVSYGHQYVTEKPTTLVLVPLGYADGVPRHASGAGPVSINGITYRVSGRIAMDQFVVDVGDADVAIGDRAVLFGDPLSGYPAVEEWASAAGTINYEIITRIGPRVKRRFVQ